MALHDAAGSLLGRLLLVRPGAGAAAFAEQRHGANDDRDIRFAPAAWPRVSGGGFSARPGDDEVDPGLAGVRRGGDLYARHRHSHGNERSLSAAVLRAV